MSERLSTEDREAIRSAAFIGPTLYGIVEAILAARLADQTARLAAVEALPGKWRKTSRAIRDATGDYEDGAELLAAADALDGVLRSNPSAPDPPSQEAV